MIIRKYGIELHRLTIDDIEIVREARNREDIRSLMFKQEYITREQQAAWFQSINNANNYYFVIHESGKKIGLINGKNTDFNKRDVEGGIFIWDQGALGTGIPAKASICFIEFTFSIFHMQSVYASIRADNPRAYHYNLSLGYQATCDEHTEQMILTKQAYCENIDRLRRIAGGREASPLSIGDIEIPEIYQIPTLYEGLPTDILKTISPAFKNRHHKVSNQK